MDEGDDNNGNNDNNDNDGNGGHGHGGHGGGGNNDEGGDNSHGGGGNAPDTDETVENAPPALPTGTGLVPPMGRAGVSPQQRQMLESKLKSMYGGPSMRMTRMLSKQMEPTSYSVEPMDFEEETSPSHLEPIEPMDTTAQRDDNTRSVTVSGELIPIMHIEESPPSPERTPGRLEENVDVPLGRPVDMARLREQAVMEAQKMRQERLDDSLFASISSDNLALELSTPPAPLHVTRSEPPKPSPPMSTRTRSKTTASTSRHIERQREAREKRERSTRGGHSQTSKRGRSAR